MNPSPLLDMIDTPQDLRRLEKKQLPQVAAELREFLLDSVGKTGGHFASNLGAVELTVALHYVYDTPEDHLVWDVGHQSYPHKILTGRKNQMHTMRQYGGLAGFPKRSESEYDAFGVGHSSTSIGAALGMAVADKQLGNNRRSVAIIGDGAMTAGQAFEALNCAGDMDVDFLVILNDNEMSISPNVGALPKYLASNVVRDMHGLLSTIKAQSSKVLDKLPGAMELAQKVENKIKTLAGEAEHAKQSLSLFENFGFRYTGPVDGHNVENLVDVLKRLARPQRPSVAARHHQKRQRLQIRRKRPCQIPRRCQTAERSACAGSQTCRVQTDLYASVRPMAVRPSGGGRAFGCHHASHARRQRLG